jgi:hypothetical protein
VAVEVVTGEATLADAISLRLHEESRATRITAQAESGRVRMERVYAARFRKRALACLILQA